ncbi:MAG: outer membrane protein/peptidoglycan-associated [Bacteroidetes bacterium]|nr:MAG: outer membrane protein/peptidoglycan-associated [Bacteroidota bacterium]
MTSPINHMPKLSILIRALFISALFFIFSPASTQAQSRRMAAADEAFNSFQYNVAVNRYKKVYSRTKSRPEKDRISFQMAECYRMMNNTKRAEVTYRRIIKSDFARKNPITYLHYADMLKAAEKYDDAKDYYILYSENVPEDPRGSNGVKSCELAAEWIKNPTKFSITNVKKLNSKSDDFAPTYADKFYNALIFTSTREGSTGKGLDDWTGQNFSDLFLSRQDRKSEWSEPALADTEGKINTSSNEGAPAFNDKFSALYFTRCSNAEDEATNCKIIVIKRTGKGWGEPQVLNLGSDSTVTNGHPAISKDELTLVFSSDRKGGQGGKDLWIATRKSAADDFNKPLNIGALVNTPGDEVFPFFKNDTTLYFASNGHPGLGGLDIFKTLKRDGEWIEPINLEIPVNSNADDFGIIFQPGEEQGFLSSNRKGGRGGDDIYYFINPPLVFTLQGTVKDELTLQFIPMATVRLAGSDGTSVDAKTDPKGFYSFSKSQIKPNTTYELTVLKDNYFNKKAAETTVGLEKNKDFVIDFLLEPIPEKPVVLPDILYDLAKWDLKPQYQDSLQGLIKTLLENETVVVELASHTDARDTDERNDILSQRRAESVVNYLIDRGIDPERLVAKGYGERVPRTMVKDVNKDGFLFKTGTILTESFIDSLKSTPEKEAAHALNRRTEFRVLSKDYVPKAKNLQIGQKVEVQVNPEDNIVSIDVGKGNSVMIPAIVNGFNVKIMLDRDDRGLIFSLSEAQKLLTSGAITKNDFIGDANVVLAEGSIADKSVFRIKEFKIGTKTVSNVEASVSHKITEGVIMGESTINIFGRFKLDENNKQLIFN